MELCNLEYMKLRRKGKQPDETDALQLNRLKFVEAAVHALRALTNKKMREKLTAAAQHLERGDPDVRMTHREQFLNNFEKDFWASCFLDLFPRGDCQERSLRRKQCPDWKWATLITRVDARRWRRSREFVACLYNVLLRRSQLRAVKLFIDSHGDRVA